MDIIFKMKFLFDNIFYIQYISIYKRYANNSVTLWLIISKVRFLMFKVTM